MLARSGADGIMVGRGAYGRPWQPGVIAEALDPGSGRCPPSLPERRAIVLGHYGAMIDFYGDLHGVKIARKHLGWYLAAAVDDGVLAPEMAATWRSLLMRETDPQRVLTALEGAFADDGAVKVAA
jgi:tRNA-dihydrouridine synthase B